MAILDRFNALKSAHSTLKSCGADPFGVKMDKILSSTEAIINGRKTILCGTNNYLGLTFDKDAQESAIEAIRELGTGTTGSRIANGSYSDHAGLEQDLADFYGMRHCMVFTTGYQANLSAISTLVGQGDYLIIDADSHASIYDGCKLGNATVVRFRHNDPADLEKRLSRIATEPGNKLIVVEGIYSMLGDQAPLKEFVEIKKKYGAYILVDEAHSMGILGKTGRGLCEAEGVEGDIDFITGTFSKSMGAIGGFLISNHEGFDILRIACRPYMFTASLPPSIIASVRAALNKLRTQPHLMKTLWRNVDVLYNGLAGAGFAVGKQKGPVVAIRINDTSIAAKFWHEALEAGIYVNLALPPATPHGTALLRCSVCAAHEPKQLEEVTRRLIKIGIKLGLIEEVQAVAAE